MLMAIPFAIVSCGDEDPGGSSTSPSPAETGQRYTATATVLESGEHGPHLCLGGVAESYPPQCGGPDITNWTWDDVTDKTSAHGTTWGSYNVVGTYDGQDFTLTEPPTAPSDPEIGSEPEISTPCDEPSGGWTVVDRSTATDEAMEAAIRYAEAQPDHGATWLDQSINPSLTDDLPADDLERTANDPTRLILNLSFTNDLERHEREIREIWGGALCVSDAAHSSDELQTIQQQLMDDYRDQALMSGSGGIRGVIELRVILDDGTLQQDVDERYGPGVVEVHSALQPID